MIHLCIHFIAYLIWRLGTHSNIGFYTDAFHYIRLRNKSWKCLDHRWHKAKVRLVLHRKCNPIQWKISRSHRHPMILCRQWNLVQWRCRKIFCWQAAGTPVFVYGKWNNREKQCQNRCKQWAALCWMFVGQMYVIDILITTSLKILHFSLHAFIFPFDLGWYQSVYCILW